MEEFLSNPGLVAILLALIPGTAVTVRYFITRSDSSRTSKMSLDEQRTRLLWWYQEHYHKGRRAIIDLGENPDKLGLPFEPDHSVLHKVSVDKE